MHIRKQLLSLFLVMGLMMSAVAGIAADQKEIRSDHFILSYAPETKRSQDIITAAERYYDSIAKELGYSRYDKFWTWDKRCHIYVYASRQEYQKATGAFAWAGGHANLKQRKIYTYVDASEEDFLKTTLPHEIAHLIFADFVGLSIGQALWLHEGIAMRAEQIRKEDLLRLGKKLFLQQKYIPLRTLVEIKQIPFSITSNEVAVFYAEALMVVSCLMDQYPMRCFISFCYDIRDKYPVEEAIRRNYSTYGIQTMNDLEQAIVKNARIL